MKHEWKKAEKSLYNPKNKPELVTVPPCRYIQVAGEGDPNGGEFARCVEALYGISYTIRMSPKQGYTPKGYFEYTVYPLEGIWENGDGEILDKSKLRYRAMIRQPDFVTDEVFAWALEAAGRKKPNLRLEGLELVTIEDRLSAQMLHVGPYDDEPASFTRMNAFLKEQGLRRSGTGHREIYLGDPRKTAPEKWRTVLRYTGLQQI